MKVSTRQKSYRIFIFVISLSLLITSVTTTYGQETQPDRGASLGSSYSIGQFDTINTTNGNLMLNFPLAVLPKGRGQATAGMYLMYNSKLYDKRVVKILDERYPCDYDEEGTESCTYYYKTLLEPSAKGGWTIGSGYSLEFENRLTSYDGNLPNCVSYGSPNGLWTEMTYIHKLYVVFPDGSRHELHPQGHNDDAGLQDSFYRVRFDGVVESCGFSQYRTGSALSYYSDDGSYLRLDVSYDNDLDSGNNTWNLYFPDGSRVTSAGYIYDRNGNSINGLTDDLGRTISGGGIGYEGADLDWTVSYKSVYVNKTYQSCDLPCPTSEQRSNLNQIFNVVDTLTEPTAMGGRTYYFHYNAHPYPSPPSGQSDGWGEVSIVELPAGGEIQYDYSLDGVDGPSNGLPDDVQVILDNHPVAKRIIHDGVTDSWTYSTGTSGGSSTGPNGFGTTDYFTNKTENSWRAGLSYLTEYTNGTKIERTWAQNKPNGNCGYHKACNPYVKTEYTSIKSGGSYSLTSIKDFTYDKNGNVTEVKEYDWVPYSTVTRTYGVPDETQSGISSYLKRKTLTAFYNDTPAASSTTYNDADSYYLTTSERLLRLPKSVEVQDSSSNPKSRSEMDYDYENYDSSNTKAGNLTETKTWDSFKGGSSQSYSNPLTGTNAITTTATYNSYGMPLTTVDANGVTTSITYGTISKPGGTVSDLYPTQTVVASGTGVARTTTMIPDFFTGLVKSTVDEDNGDLTTVFDYDDIGRPIQVNTASGVSGLESRTTTEYDDGNLYIMVRSDLAALNDGKLISIQHFDQLGRPRLARTMEGGSPSTCAAYGACEANGIKVATKYANASGYTYQLVSNPYRTTSDDTMGWTRTKTWTDGTQSETETFSGSSLPAPWGANTTTTGKVTTLVDANVTTVEDQAGKLRRLIKDGLGRLTRVDEPNSSNVLGSIGSPNQETNYTYDVFDNLLSVTQGSQTRSFTYSSTSRMRTVANPESGTTTYTYDSNGNLTSQSDARSITTSYTYDSLNRVTQRSYNDSPQTPTVTFTYDNKTNAVGRLTKVSNSNSATEFTTFDAVGRVTAHKQTIGGNDYTTSYTYNVAGMLVEETYPSGRVVKNTVGVDGRISQVETKPSAGSYTTRAGSFTYNALGAVVSTQLGSGLWESTVFNPRFQPTEIALGTTQNGDNVLKLEYGFGTTANNGNVQSQTITVPSVAYPFVQAYTYDSLNRISGATETYNSSQTWTQVFGYDRYGNRNITSGTGSTSLTFDASSNKITTSGYTYDSAGNTTADPAGKSFVFNGDNKQTMVANGGTLGTYSYDGDGKRVSKDASTGDDSIFIYDASGKLIEERNPASCSPLCTLKTSYVYVGSELLSTEAPGPTTTYLTADHLGTPRINTDGSGTVLARHDYMPFGDEIFTALTPQRTTIVGYPGADSERQQFTGYERDDETELDFAQARMYSYKLGRFLSADEPLLDQQETDPQSWNLYSYVTNSPLRYTDPTGLWKKVDCTSGECWEAEEGDTLTSLASIVGISARFLTAFFSDVNPRNIAIGHTFDLGQYDYWSMGSNFQRAPGEPAFNYDDPSLAQDIPNEMQPDKPTNHPLVDGAPAFIKGAEDGLDFVLQILSRRGGKIPKVSNGRLSNIVNDLFKGALTRNPIGTGSTADAIRYERATGKMVGNKYHFRKGVQYRQALEKWIKKNPNASDRDRRIAERLKRDLEDAMTIK